MRRLITGLAVVVGALVSAVPTASADPTLDTYTFPIGVKSAEGIAAAPDGTVYVGTDDNSKTPPIAKVDPAQVSAGTAKGVTLIASPPHPDPAVCCVRLFRDMSYSAKSNALFWTRSDGQVGKLDATGMSSITLTGNIEPFGIAAAPDGGAWFSEKGASNVGPAYAGNRIAYVSRALGGPNEQVNLALQGGRTTLDSLRYAAQPKGMTIGVDGKPWFVSSDGGNPGWRIGTTKGAEYEEYRLCPCGSGVTALTDVVAATDGTLWYTNEFNSTVGRFNPASHDYQEFSLVSMDPTLSGGKPFALAAAGDGSVWLAVSGFAKPAANAIVKLVPGVGAPQATVYKIGAAIAPTSIATDTKGNVWFSGSSFGGPGGFGRLGNAFSGDPGPGGGGGGGGGEQSPATPPATNSPPAQTVTLTPVVSARATVSDPRVNGDSISANQICVGPPQDRCSLVYLIQTHEYVTGFPGTHGYMAKAKKLTTIGTLKVTLKGGQKKKVTIKLNRKGRKLRKKMTFKATLTVTQSINGAKPKQILKKNLKFRK
ncbi:hypothetical protein OM076_23085 [Solirubrobacter ginsenosidimutans]|uniref:Uncharacterized protein n=1 Tax=Solirubrobacter ginsenosidimutans TaxID=490573 RepID=A0A9X3MXX9_9ACTN|nr:hypothetical protein [Solirubrobacter ginsenosidimutans]MDA0163177.1 hypothetical protein [Solirubrobacter ginsenosidimutans]